MCWAPYPQSNQLINVAMQNPITQLQASFGLGGQLVSGVQMQLNAQNAMYQLQTDQVQQQAEVLRVQNMAQTTEQRKQLRERIRALEEERQEYRSDAAKATSDDEKQFLYALADNCKAEIDTIKNALGFPEPPKGKKKK